MSLSAVVKGVFVVAISGPRRGARGPAVLRLPARATQPAADVDTVDVWARRSGTAAPPFSGTDQAGRHPLPRIVAGAEGRDARVLPLRRLVTLLQDAARGAARPLRRHPHAGARPRRHQLRPARDAEEVRRFARNHVPAALRSGLRHHPPLWAAQRDHGPEDPRSTACRIPGLHPRRQGTRGGALLRGCVSGAVHRRAILAARGVDPGSNAVTASTPHLSLPRHDQRHRSGCAGRAAHHRDAALRRDRVCISTRPASTTTRWCSSTLDPQPWLRVHETRYPPSEIYHFKPLDERVEVYAQPFRLTRDVTLLATPEAQEQLGAMSSVTLTGALEDQAATMRSASTRRGCRCRSR